jgi:glutamate-1-semialdehyde aminotransferase
VVIVDEITAGWRLTLGGAHLVTGVTPDIAVFAKAMGNGYPIAAVIGREAVMQAAQGSFISSTYWTERIGPCAALATIKKLRESDGPAKLVVIGRSVQEGWKACARAAGLSIHVSGIPPLSHFEFVHSEPLLLKTLFTQFMLERGFLASTVFYSSLAHTPSHVGAYLAAAGEVFSLLADAVKNGKERSLLKGEICHAGFRRLN